MASDGLNSAIKVPRPLWSRAIIQLRKRSAGKRESGAFLLCPTSSTVGKVTGFVCYDDLDPDAYQSGAIAFHAARLPTSPPAAFPARCGSWPVWPSAGSIRTRRAAISSPPSFCLLSNAVSVARPTTSTRSASIRFRARARPRNCGQICRRYNLVGKAIRSPFRRSHRVNTRPGRNHLHVSSRPVPHRHQDVAGEHRNTHRANRWRLSRSGLLPAFCGGCAQAGRLRDFHLCFAISSLNCLIRAC